jgi:hypothetical protein
MKIQLTREDYKLNYEGKPEIGFLCFMGGVNLESKQIVVATNNKFYLFTEGFDEISLDIIKSLDIDSRESS